MPVTVLAPESERRRLRDLLRAAIGVPVHASGPDGLDGVLAEVRHDAGYDRCPCLCWLTPLYCPRASLRPPVSEARIADHYRQRGLDGPPLQQEVGTVLGGYVKLESITVGFRWGLRFLSLMMLPLGETLVLLLWRAARGLRA